MQEFKNEVDVGTGVSGETPVTVSRRRLLRVWVVDDHAQLRDLLGQFLNRQPGIKCTRHFPSAEDLLATLAEERPPDMILLDVNLKGQSGLSAIRPIRKLAPSVRVVMMTTFTNSHYEREAFDAGASGFLLKTYELEDILKVLRAADREPGAAALFPNLVLQEAKTLAFEQRGLSSRGKRFSLIGSFRQLCGVRRGKVAN